jgi:TPP-dependent pyruvate/acetoin dehydrogenase alpha subunit
VEEPGSDPDVHDLKGLHELSDDQVNDIEARVKTTIDDAVDFAMSAPDPDPSEAAGDLYA